MVMGDICTRGCRFCAVNTRRNGPPLDPDEPVNVARAIAEMDLDYVVLTSVDRDDLVDQGASHFASCVREIRKASPKTLVEILVPDFCGRMDLVDLVVASRPEVIAHNLETIRRLTPTVRDPRAGYDQSLAVLKHLKEEGCMTKSSLMLGLGETVEETQSAMADLRGVGCDFLTLGQYLRPSQKHLEVAQYVPPETFAQLEQDGLAMGFSYVASGPLVRSSYKAGEFFIRRALEAAKEHA
jgi:lipoic acid synthetase